MEDKGISLDLENDVISQQSNSENLLAHWPLNFTVSEILALVRVCLSEDEQAFIDGFECKVLQPGKAWQTGKIRINVEFCPDNPM